MSTGSNVVSLCVSVSKESNLKTQLLVTKRRAFDTTQLSILSEFLQAQSKLISILSEFLRAVLSVESVACTSSC
jgi:hypothetical protein